MKRNNIFMLAYIAFIIISVIVRLFTDYSAWAFIVPAVTICSAVFAWADFVFTFGRTKAFTCDLMESRVLDKRKEIDKQVKLFSSIKMELLSVENDDLARLMNNVEKVDRDIISTIESIKELIRRDRLFSKKLIKCSTVLYFIGILVFLCIIVFERVRITVVGYQDIISVFAFAIILISQYVSELYEDRYQKLVDSCDEIEAGIESCYESLKDIANSVVG